MATLLHLEVFITTEIPLENILLFGMMMLLGGKAQQILTTVSSIFRLCFIEMVAST